MEHGRGRGLGADRLPCTHRILPDGCGLDLHLRGVWLGRARIDRCLRLNGCTRRGGAIAGDNVKRGDGDFRRDCGDGAACHRRRRRRAFGGIGTRFDSRSRGAIVRAHCRARDRSRCWRCDFDQIR
jgi:hypothetical protein